MNRDDLLWLAGLTEGEAVFDLHREKYPRIRIGMTDRDTVGRAATLLGCSVRLSYRRPPQSAMWHAEISGARAAEVMEQLLPHMGARRSSKIATILGHYALSKETDRGSAPGPRIVRPPALPLERAS